MDLAGKCGFLTAMCLVFPAAVLAQSNNDIESINKLVGELEDALSKAPAPPDGMDTEALLGRAAEIGIVRNGGQDTIEIDDTDLRPGGTKDAVSDSHAQSAVDDDPARSKTAATDGDEEGGDKRIMTLAAPTTSDATDSDPEQRSDPASTAPGSPALYFWQNIHRIPAQECMRRAKSAFESMGMTIGNGDYWWYGAHEARYHSYSNCLDIGNGNTIVNFTTTGWQADTLVHLNRLIAAFNNAAGTSPQESPFTDNARPIPALHMWVQTIDLPQSECIQRSTNAFQSQGLTVSASDTWFVAGQDARFHTYVTCTDLGSGEVYVNVTAASAQNEDLRIHRDAVVREILRKP